MQLQTEGIVLRSTNYSEADVILNIYTLKYGKIGAYAKYARRLKSPLMSFAQPFAYGNVFISTSDGRYKLTKAELIDNNYKITSDYERINLGYYYLQFVEKAGFESEANIKLFTLLKNALKELQSNDNYLLQKVVYDMKIVESFGYKPNMVSCINCGGQENLGNGVDFAEGGRICSNCFGQSQRENIRMDSTSFRFIKYAQEHTYNTILQAQVNKKILLEINTFMDKFIDYHFDGINLTTRKLLQF